MKKILLPIACSLLSLCLSAQKSAKLDSVKAQMARKHYLTAFETISTAESEAQQAIPLLTRLILEGNEGTTEAFDRWMLSDRNGTTQLRTERIELPLETVLINSMQEYPSDCAIYSSLSRFYEKVLELKHLYTPLETLDGIKNFIEKKVPATCVDEHYYYVVGYAANYLGKPAAARIDLQKAITINTRYAPAYLELANSYYLTKDYPNAISRAMKAYDLTSDRVLRSRAALKAADAYDAQNDQQNALSYYLLADSINRKEFFNQKALLNFYVKTNNPKAPDAINAFLGAQSRTNLSNYLDVLEIYTRHNRLPDLSMYCQKSLANYEGRPEIQACFNFLLGKIYQPLNLESAKLHFRKAKEQGIKADRYQATRTHPTIVTAINEAFALVY